MRGAGKSSLGQALARRLNRSLVELDALIEARAGMSLSMMFALHDETFYRRLELEALRNFLATPSASVLAAGGGIVTSPESWRLLMAHCRVVWLKADAEDHWERVVSQGDHRPMAERATAMAELQALLRAREPLYGRAHSLIDTSSLGFEGSLEALLAEVGELSPP
jgi:XRE family aerobic/anaerobic benzoate catabolism transcriptional regulator